RVVGPPERPQVRQAGAQRLFLLLAVALELAPLVELRLELTQFRRQILRLERRARRRLPTDDALEAGDLRAQPVQAALGRRDLFGQRGRRVLVEDPLLVVQLLRRLELGELGL